MTRQTAQEQTTAARRVRTGNLGATMRMSVDMAKLDTREFEYRWINDRGARLGQLAGPDYDDWAICTQEGGELKADATDMGTAVSMVTGTDKMGAPERAYLCRKPKAWVAEDRARRERQRAEVDESIRTLAAPNTGVAQGAFYNPTPGGRNTVG